MKKFLLLFSLTILFIHLTPCRAFGKEAQLTIHAIDLQENVKGDAVLLESQGEYLLMDTGESDPKDTVIHYLKSQGVKSLSVYISHFHTDHIGELNDIINQFDVQKLYVPWQSIYEEAALAGDSYHESFLNKYLGLKAKAGKNGYEFIPLKKGSHFTFGDASLDIIGPSRDYKLSEFKDDNFLESGKTETALEHYLNNSSLSAMIRAGSQKFLSCGDIEQTEETALLKSGISLKADLFKLNHHGTDTSNSSAFLKAVSPSHSFAIYDTSQKEISKYGLKKAPLSVYGLIRTREVMETAEKYGEIYRTGFNGTIVFTIGENGIQAACKTGFRTKDGKTYLYVNDKLQKGLIQNVNQSLYYTDKNGVLQSGLKKVKGKIYLFTGTHGQALVNAGLVKYKKAFYYIGKEGFALTGLKSIQGKKYYFDKKSGKMAASQIVKIKGHYFYFDKKGIMYTKGWKTIGKKKYYFNPNGKAYTGSRTINGKKYYFDNHGVLKKSL